MSAIGFFLDPIGDHSGHDVLGQSSWGCCTEYITPSLAQRIEAEKARFVELDADGATVENFVASKLSGKVMNTGRKELFVSYGAFGQLFDVPANAHFTIMVSSEDGSYASAQVINAGGVLRVIPNGGEGIDVVARGTSVGVIAASKKITASWTRTG